MWQVGATEENVHILGIPYCGRINGCHPCGNRIPPDDGIRHTG
jgi:hypothetical protein